MEPPIHTEYLRSGGAITRILLPAGAREMISFCRRSASPTRKMIANNRLYLTCSIQYGYGEILNFSCTLHYITGTLFIGFCLYLPNHVYSQMHIR